MMHTMAALHTPKKNQKTSMYYDGSMANWQKMLTPKQETKRHIRL